MSGAAWLLVYLASALVFLIASGALDSIGWAFYHATMAQAARKRELRELRQLRQLARMEMAAAVAQYQAAQLLMLTSLHQHAHTMAGLTGQAYLVTPSYGLMQIMVPEAILPVRHYDISVPELSDDPRHNPWVILPPP